MGKVIYHVRDKDDAVVYVGCSMQNLHRRMNEHRSLARRGVDRHPFMLWILEELKAGRTPVAVCIRNAAKNWREDERLEILKQIEAGQPILNVICRSEPY